MKKLTLNGSWKLDIPGKNYVNVSAVIPGSVYHDLMTAGLMEDPFYRDNEMDALALMDIRVTADLGEKLAKAAAHGGTAVVAVMQGEPDAQAVSALLDGTLLAEYEKPFVHGACAVYDGGLLQGEQVRQWLAQRSMQLEEDAGGGLFIRYRDAEYLHRMDGVNLLLLDTRTGEVYQTVSYGEQTGYTAYTG